MSILKIENLCKSYFEKTVLDSLYLEVDEGEMVAIVGESGAGKSTLLNIIGLLEDYDEGRLEICGEAAPKINSKEARKFVRNNINYLFQNFALVDDGTVRYNLLLALTYNKSGKKEKERFMLEALKGVSLEKLIDNYIYQLSGGEQQRVAIARLMLKPSKIILADEPTGSLDEKNKNFIIELLLDLKRKGNTIITVTHDLDFASRCDRIIKLNQ